MVDILKSLLNRREFSAFVVALVIMAATALGQKAGLAVPANEITFVVEMGITNVLMAFLEGTFKPGMYGDAWKNLLQSKKLHLVLVSLVGVILNEFVLVPFGVIIPEEVLGPIGAFLFGTLLLKGGVDTVQAIVPRFRS